MKKILSVVMITFLSISAFAYTTDNGKLDKGKKKKGRTSSTALALNIVEEDPIFAFAGDMSTIDNQVTVKVFDITGKIVMEKKVKIENIFNSKGKLEELPKNSVFVMFHQNTAYYFLESEK